MSKHTPTPWKVGKHNGPMNGWPIYHDGQWLAVALDHLLDPLANAHRITAAVNVCEGISTGQLETLPAGRLAQLLVNEGTHQNGL